MRRVAELVCVVIWAAMFVLVCAGWLAPDDCEARTGLLEPSNCG